MDEIIQKILDELYQLKQESNKSSSVSTNDDILYGEYLGITKAIKVVEKHYKNE